MKNEFAPGILEGAAGYVIEHLRPRDTNEVWALSHQTPREAVETSIKLSTMLWTVVIDDRFAAVCGCAPHEANPGLGIPWLLGTEDLHRGRVFFYRESEPVIHAMLMRYPKLVNFVDARNRHSLRWLQWLKFKIHPPVAIGIEQMLFHRVEREAK